MIPAPDTEPFDARLARCRRTERAGSAEVAEAAYRSLCHDWPDRIEAFAQLSRWLSDRGRGADALALLQAAHRANLHQAAFAIELALAHLQHGEEAAARALLDTAVAHDPEASTAWLLLGRLRAAAGDELGALRAWHEAVTRAQRRGEWHDERSTPPALLDDVLDAIEAVRTGRRRLLATSVDDLRETHGAPALRRVDAALAGLLGQQAVAPADPRQRPRFLYFPDLPGGPFQDPSLQPWAPALKAAFGDIRDEALQVVADRTPLPHFVDLRPGDRMDRYVGGTGPAPAWEAFFFYRHGRRYDDNHARCPRTSALLESIELCRIDGEAPEICFSVLEPGSHILPHHGVTNTRLVMHLPLVVPPDCALNLVGVAEHRWQAGELVMFDDTYQHEAWNRSGETRLVLLMDCWNPHLTPVEKTAVKRIVELTSRWRQASKAAPAG